MDLKIPIPATIFLAVVLGLLLLLIMTMFYVRKEFCFKKSKGCLCLAEQVPANEESQESEDDSDEDVKRRHTQLVKHSETKSVSSQETVQSTMYEEETRKPATDLTEGASDSESGLQVGEKIQRFSTVAITVSYEASRTTFRVQFNKVDGLVKKVMGGFSLYQLSATLMPEKKKRYRSSFFTGESYTFKSNNLFENSSVLSDKISQIALRIRLYGCERNRRSRLVAETTLALESLNLKEKSHFEVALEKRKRLKNELHGRQSLSDDAFLGVSDNEFAINEEGTSEAALLSSIPEILIGLSYNKLTACLLVEIVKGLSFKIPHSRVDKPADSYIKITIMAKNGQELARSKSTVKKGQKCPVFREKFSFQIAQFQIPELSIILSAYHKRSVTKNILIGWIGLGHYNTGCEEEDHWQATKMAYGEVIYRTHQLR